MGSISEAAAPRIVAVVGPTASGKTALSLGLCRKLGGEVICCDSMQVYRGMDIGTAKPTDEERAAVPHHLVDIADPCETFTAADYVAAAEAAANDVLARGRVPVFCGGTGLYLDSFLRGGFSQVREDAEYREQLARFAAEHGNEALHARLAKIDPESAAAIHPNNVRRVIRALEIYHTEGLTKAELDRRSRESAGRYDAVVIGLRYADRELLYRRIDLRVDAMVQAGLVGEVERLDRAGVFDRSGTAAQAIGYKELLPFVHGECSLEKAVDSLKTATRRYAKRQLTWFGAHGDVHWLDCDTFASQQELLAAALALCHLREFADGRPLKSRHKN